MRQTQNTQVSSFSLKAQAEMTHYSQGMTIWLKIPQETNYTPHTRNIIIITASNILTFMCPVSLIKPLTYHPLLD